MHQNDTLLIDDVDTTGALRDAAEKVSGGHTRASFLAKGTLAAGAALTGGGLLTAATASAATTKNDVDILNFALLLEYLESAFYTDALTRNVLTGDTLHFAQVAGKHEANHVVFIQKALGSAAIQRPTFDFSKTSTDAKSFLATAVTLEDTGVSAYKGQAPLVDSTPILQSALLIHSVEARHAAWARRLAGKSPIIAPADKALTKAQVTAAVKATGFITG